MAQKRLHFLLLLSIPWIALYARCVEAFDCSTSESWDEICREGDVLLSAWIPRLNCSVPNEITLRYTDERNRTISDFGNVLLNGQELRLECYNNDSQATCIYAVFGEADVIGGTYTFSNLNETGIFPGWTCMVKGCFSEDEDVFYRTPSVSCTLSPATSTVPAISTTTAISTSPQTEPSSTSVVSSTKQDSTSDRSITSASSTPTIMVNYSSTNENGDTESFTTIGYITSVDEDPELDSYDHLYAYVLVMLAILIIIILLLGITLLICRRQYKFRNKMLMVYDKQNMVFDPAFNPAVSVDKPAFFIAPALSTTSLNLLQRLNPVRKMNEYVEAGGHPNDPHSSFEIEWEGKDAPANDSKSIVSTVTMGSISDDNTLSSCMPGKCTASIDDEVIASGGEDNGDGVSFEENSDPLHSSNYNEIVPVQRSMRAESLTDDNDSVLTEVFISSNYEGEYDHIEVHPSISDYVQSNSFSEPLSSIETENKTVCDHFELDVAESETCCDNGNLYLSSFATFDEDSLTCFHQLTLPTEGNNSLCVDTLKPTNPEVDHVCRIKLDDHEPHTTMTTDNYIVLHPPVDTTFEENERENCLPFPGINDYSLSTNSSPSKNDQKAVNLDVPFACDSSSNGYIPSESLTREILVPAALVPTSQERSFTVHLDFNGRHKAEPVLH